MQNIIIEKPYQFVPPHHGTFWSWLIKLVGIPAWQLRKSEGVVAHEVRGIERLRESIAAGHGILLTPNHPRTADPVAFGLLGHQVPCHVFAMASWHLFHQGWVNTWAIRMMGGFSVNREGVDRQAITTAIDLLSEGRRPLIIFPEGATSRINDRLQALLDGVAFIARSAAKKRARHSPPGKVVVHPVGIKYLFSGDIHKAADEVLTDIEHRFTWQPQRELPLLLRIGKVGSALLGLKELEYFGQTQTGRLGDRLRGLMDHLLGPIEKEWLGSVQTGKVVPRVRNLRVKILPDMVAGSVDKAERTRRWKHLADIYLAQQLSCYPPDYLAQNPSVDRVLEIIEKFEEDLFDKARRHGHLKVILQIAPAIEVSPERVRGVSIDPLMVEIEQSLQQMIDELAKESRPLESVAPELTPCKTATPSPAGT
ncbi:MAG: 1-acyl-sn-glycerol-3-phosphate acyltransferase [Pirellulaceae bacterium]|nr:1-acyl-sn-glycerol-3-phosphate acyltransferase [Pirellulaceae bacterium]